MSPEIRATVIGIVSAVITIATFVHVSQRSLRNDVTVRIDGHVFKEKGTT